MQRAVGESKSALLGESPTRSAKPEFHPGDGLVARELRRVRYRTVGGGISSSSLITLSAQWDQIEKVTRPYEQNPWVHACLKAIGQAVASVPLRVYVGDPRIDRQAKELPQTDPLVRLLSAPNPLMTAAQFHSAGAHHHKLDGEDFWFLLADSGKPIALTGALKIPIPRYILSVRGAVVRHDIDPATGWVRQWRTSLAGGAELVAPPGSVVQFRDYNPDNPIRGIGDIEAAWNEIDLDLQSTRYQRAIIKNSGDPGGFVAIEGAPLAEPEHRALEAEIHEEQNVRNAGRLKVLRGKGITYTPNKLGPRDMDFAMMKAWNRDVIAGVCGVPLPIIGVYEHATLNNVEQAKEDFWNGGNGVLTLLYSREDTINAFLRKIDHPQAEQLFARYDTSGIKALQDDRNLQLEIADRLSTPGSGISKNEALALAGVEVEPGFLKNGDVVLVPSGLVPIERALAEPEPEEEEDPPAGGGDEGGDDPPPPKDDAKDEKAAQPVVSVPAVANRDAAEEAQARRDYWDVREAKVLVSGEAAVRRKYLAWRRKYEAAQFKRLRDFVAEGPDGVRFAKPVTKGPDDLGGGPGTVTRSEVEMLLLELEEWREKLEAAARDPIKGTFLSALDDIADELGADALMQPTDPRVIRFLEQQVIQLAEGHTSTLANQVRDVLTEALEKATSTGTLQQRVEEVLPELTDSLKTSFANRSQRAQTIARTETAKAANGARHMGMVEAGVDEHEWITSKDNFVRGTPGGPYADSEYDHHSLDGKTARIGTLFDPEGHPGLKFPCDPDGQPGDVINCRCVSRPVVRKSSSEQEGDS